jgi:hypothetical protein
LIVKIKYKYNKKIDYIILTSFHKNTYWQLYLDGNPYFIFRYVRGLSSYRYKMHRNGVSSNNVIGKILKDNGKLELDFQKLIKADPTIKNKIIQWKDPMIDTIGDIDDIITKNNSVS